MPKQREDEQPEDEQPEDEQPEDDQPEDEQPEDEQPEDEPTEAEARPSEAELRAANPLTRPLDYPLMRRRLMIGIFLVAVLGGAWWAMQKQRLLREDQLVKQVEALGAIVLFDTAIDAQGQVVDEAERSAGLLSVILGSDPFRKVEGVALQPDFDPEAITHFAHFPELRYVSFQGAAPTVDDIDALAKASRQIETLDLRGVTIDSKLAESLEQLSHLRRIEVDSEQRDQLPESMQEKAVARPSAD